MRMQESLCNKEDRASREQRGELVGYGQPPRKPPDLETVTTVVAVVLVETLAAEEAHPYRAKENCPTPLKPPYPIPWVEANEPPSEADALPHEEMEAKMKQLSPDPPDPLDSIASAAAVEKSMAKVQREMEAAMAATKQPFSPWRLRE